MSYSNHVSASRHHHADEPRIEYALLSDSDPAMKSELIAAYTQVMHPCFSQMGVKLEPVDSFCRLACVNHANPQAHFHLITAKAGEKTVGACCFVAYDGENAAYWIYDAVNPDYRGRNIATKMHHALYAHCDRHFRGHPFTVFAEMPVTNRSNFYERMASMGFREIDIPYIDSLGAEGWAPVLRRFGAGGSDIPQPDNMPKAELMRLLTLNRQLPPNSILSPEQQKEDRVLAFYRKALAKTAGDEVKLFPVPMRYHCKQYRFNEGARSCPDLY